MKKHLFISYAILTAVIGNVLAVPAWAASLPMNQLPAPALVQEQREELLGRGCVEVIPEGANQIVNIPEDKPIPIAASNWTVDRPMFCPQAVAESLTTKQGQVKPIEFVFLGAVLVQQTLCRALATGPIPVGTPDFFGGTAGAGYGICYWATGIIIGAIGVVFFAILGAFAFVVNLILQIFSLVLSKILLLGQFTTHPFVLNTAPILQNFVNIAFIFGLLFIALRTIISPGGFDYKKPLVRLLIAALLINFSLVICGVLIDASRLVMAIELRTLAGGDTENVHNIGTNFLAGAPVNCAGDCVAGASGMQSFKEVFALDRGGTTMYWVLWYKNGFFPGNSIFVTDAQAILSLVIKTLIATLSLISITLGVTYIGVGILIRYIALLMLCATAPVAFLGYIFDNLHDSITKKWWSNFVKYVLYGPIAILFLIVLTRVARSPRIEFGDSMFNDIFGAIAMAGLFIGSAIFATKINGFAASWVTDKTYGVAKRNPRVGAAVLTGGLSAALPAANWATRQTVGKIGKAVSGKDKAWYNPRRWAGGVLQGLGARPQDSMVVKTAKSVKDFVTTGQEMVAKQAEQAEKKRQEASRGTSGAQKFFKSEQDKEETAKILKLGVEEEQLKEQLKNMPPVIIHAMPQLEDKEFNDLIKLNRTPPLDLKMSEQQYFDNMKKKLDDPKMENLGDEQADQLKKAIDANTGTDKYSKDYLKASVDRNVVLRKGKEDDARQADAQNPSNKKQAQLDDVREKLNRIRENPAKLASGNVAAALQELSKKLYPNEDKNHYIKEMIANTDQRAVVNGLFNNPVIAKMDHDALTPLVIAFKENKKIQGLSDKDKAAALGKLYAKREQLNQPKK